MINTVFSGLYAADDPELIGTCCCGLHCSCDGRSQEYSSSYFGGYFDTLNSAINQ